MTEEGKVGSHSPERPFGCRARVTPNGGVQLVVQLRVFNGYNTAADRIQLGEFEVYSTDGLSIVGSHAAQLPDQHRGNRRAGVSGGPWKDVPIHQSGLLGPVRLIPGIEKAIALQE